MSHILSIDLGTSSVKVLLVSETGEITGRGSAEYPIQQPQPNYAEQSPQQWWQAMVSAVREATVTTPPIAAMAFSGQMHGTVLLDAAGAVLAPAIIWSDQRSAAQVREITDLIGAARLIEITGSPLATGFQAATIRWLQQHQPDLWRQTAKVLLPKDYLRWRLTGAFHTDPSDGSGTLLLDVRARDWSDELLTALDIAREKLPSVQPSTAQAGTLTPEAAAALGLEAGIPVIIGGGDTPCSAIGAGLVREQDVLLTLSTGGQVVLPAPRVAVDRRGRLHTFCAALEPTSTQAGWYHMGAILSVGRAVSWLREDVLGFAGDVSELVALAESVPPGADGLTFLPYLSGERTPHMDPHARAIFFGLTGRHGRAEFVRAVLEGVTLACYQAFEALRTLNSGESPTRLILGGGGANSALWRQLVADVFGLPVQRLTVSDQSALGAAILGGAGVGLFAAAETAQAWANYDPPITPNSARHAFYQEKLPLFERLYQQHQRDFAAMT